VVHRIGVIVTLASRSLKLSARQGDDHFLTADIHGEIQKVIVSVRDGQGQSFLFTD
jgi:hypothetical protein